MSANDVDNTTTTFYFEEITDDPISIPSTAQEEEDDEVERGRIDDIEPRTTGSFHREERTNIDDGNENARESSSQPSSAAALVYEHLKACPLSVGGGATLTVVGRDAFVFGGCSRSGTPSGSIHRYSIDLDQWYPNTTCTTAKGAAPPPQARFGHTAVAYRHSIYVFGGQGLSNRPVDDNNATASSSCGGPVSFRDLHRLDTRTMEWAVVDVAANADTPSPDARNSHTCVLLLNDGDDGDGDGDDGDDRVILFGGANERLGPQNDVWSLTLKTRVWTRVQCGGHGGVPCGREMHSACVVVDDGGDGGARRRRMYVMGGRDGDGRVCHDSWTLDLDDHTWTQLAKPPSPRCAHTTTPIRTRSRHGLYSFGGWDGRNEFYDDCTVYDMDTKLWLRTPVRIAASSSSDDDVVPRFAHALCAIDSDRNDDRGEGYAPRALIFGGVNTLSDLRDLVLVRGQQGDDG